MAKIITLGIDSIENDKFAIPFNGCKYYLNKPVGGLWGCTYRPNEVYKSDWALWAYENNFHLDKYAHGIYFNLTKKAKVIDIITKEDYLELLKNYTLTTNEFGNNVYSIDWDKLSKEYDAIHIGEDIIYDCETRYDIYLDNGDKIKGFYDYDIESWIIFNLDCINKGSILNISINYNAIDYREVD